MVIDPVLLDPTDAHQGALIWQWSAPVTALSSAPVGGGLSEPSWLVNIGVPLDYRRTDLATHATEVAAECAGAGIALFTAANVNQFRAGACDGVLAHATVGISKPTWAADPSGSYTRWTPGGREVRDKPIRDKPRSLQADAAAPVRSAHGPLGHGSARNQGADAQQLSAEPPGTINIVVQLPVGLEVSAAVNAVMTVTEAKTQALQERNVPGTGTASDAVVIVWDSSAPAQAFAGPRSEWGSRIAQATHHAVLSGIDGWS